MLIEESHIDVPTKAAGEGTMRLFIFHPSIPGYPKAKFPGVVLFSEIYQVTGPVSRFARLLAGTGYIVIAPSSYHEFTSPAALAYDVPGTDAGNLYKVQKTLAAYDEDAKLSVDALLNLEHCNGRVGTTGMCLGGHLALRCCVTEARRVRAGVCWFATDVHSRTLGAEGEREGDDTLKRVGEFNGQGRELVMIFGKRDGHVPRQGRDEIRRALEEGGVENTWVEIAGAQHAFVRDDLSKGRYDPAVTRACWGFLDECFERRLKMDLGEEGKRGELEDVC